MVVSGSPSDAGSYAAEGAWHFTAQIDLVPQWTIFGPEGQRTEALVLHGYSPALVIMDSMGLLAARVPMKDVAIQICDVAWPSWRDDT
jgi:hypothetical protein